MLLSTKHKKTTSKLTGLIPSVDSKPLLLRICDECYEMLTTSIAKAEEHNIVVVYCPHHCVLINVALEEGEPIGVIMSGPLTEEEAKAKIESEYDFASTNIIVEAIRDERDPPVRSRMLFLASSARADLISIRFLL
jgi:hypothetical protein